MIAGAALLTPATGGILLAIFGTIWIGLGIWWGRKAKDLDGFMLAGRNVGMSLGSATTMATWVTSNTIMLAPLFALEKGVWGLLAYSTASFGLIFFAPLAARIHRVLPKGYTSGDFFKRRFGTLSWSFYLIITIIYSMAWLVTMGIAGGKLLESLADVNYVAGMSVILFVCVTYTIFGGLYAVIGTDFVQSLVILVGVIGIGVLILNKVPAAEIHADIAERSPALLDIWMPAALLAIFNNLFFGFGEVFHNNVWWSRAFAMRRKVAPRAFALSALLWLPIPVAAGFIGLCAGPLGIHIEKPDAVGPFVAASVLGEAGAIVVFIVVFCSLASSIDSLLAATSDLLTEDIYKKMINPQASPETLRRAAVGSVLVLGVICWAICVPAFDLLQVLFLSGPLVASTIWPVIAGLYWKRAPGWGAAAAMAAGTAVGLYAYFYIGWFTASLISAGISMLVMCLTTALAPSPTPFSWLAAKRDPQPEKN